MSDNEEPQTLTTRADRGRIAADVRAAQAGDDRAFANIVAAFQDIAVAYATSILGDYQLATVSKPRAMAEMLFANGMDPYRPNWMRVAPLHRFARAGDVESAAV